MTNKETTEFGRYSDIPKILGQELLFFEMYGSYQGDWLMASKDKNNIYIRKDYFGSCPGCDAFESFDMEFDGDEGKPTDKVKDFCKGYSPAHTISLNLSPEKIKEEIKAGLNHHIDVWGDIQKKDIAIAYIKIAKKLGL